ncbi:MAG TPA: PASTA domain-containing protein [Patescibacteria group bacterium]|nr:PASTA domain-containing protein [Patescibacteria group bacterium]
MASSPQVEQDLEEQAAEEEARAQALEEQNQLDRLQAMQEQEEEAQEPFQLPNLTGMTKGRAESELAELGLRSFVFGTPSDLPAGLVLVTKPRPGAMVHQGKRIILLVSKKQKKEEEKEEGKENGTENKESGSGDQENIEGGEREGEVEAPGESGEGFESPGETTQSTEGIGGNGTESTAEGAETVGEGAEAAEGLAGEASGAALGTSEAAAESLALAENAAVAAEAASAAAEAATVVEGATAAAGAGSGIIVSAPVWGPIVAIIALVGLIVGLVIFIFAASFTICNGGGTGSGYWASFVRGNAAYLGISSLCGPLTQQATLAGGASGGGGASGSFNGDAAARAELAVYGITVNKADCTDPAQTNCTSLDHTLEATIQEIIKVTSACDISLGGTGTTNKCGVVVTGGSEAGHESGVCSHANGFKMDMTGNNSLTSYIENNFTADGARGGTHAGEQFSDPSITSSFVLETTPAHWDVSVTCIG